jgi:glucosamine 6-phosphate synthetase-like amidotransferase/phosphosugar isomerase protein
LKVLERLEVHRYAYEPRPVGGYGAGVAILEDGGNLWIEKVGKIGDVSPAKQVSALVKICQARVFVGHVRMPSPEFMASVKFKETAQPYVVQRNSNSVIVSVHNGKVENYKELRLLLSKEHVFESEKVELIDSEVIPHLFQELLDQKGIDEALSSLFRSLQGSSAIGILHLNDDRAFLHFIHKGKTRGLTIWTNDQGEVVFCSRKEPLMEEFSDILTRGKFKEKISIAYHEDAGLKLSYPLALR